MKKLKIISAFALASMTLFSCSSDDDSSSSSTSIEGTWTIHEMKISGVPFPLTDCDAYQTLEFTDVNSVATYYDGEGCTTVDYVETYPYTINGQTLTMTDDDGKTQTATIMELTSSVLKIKAEAGIIVAETTYKR